MLLHNFIVFEGLDGSGTSTQLQILSERLGEKIFATAEPTSLPTGVFLRKMLKGNFSVDERTAAYLFAADRCEHIYGNDGIISHINNGQIVVSDRYLFSTLAYQSIGGGNDIPHLVNSQFPLPEMLFYFRINPDLSFERITKRESQKEIYEKIDFLKKTSLQYDKVIDEFKEKNEIKIITLDASLPIKETSEKIWSYLENMPILKM